MKTTSSGPRVIGCGHLRVRTKSDNEFPALLVCLPCGGNDECRYFWRTKRDFLLLNRSLRQHNDASTTTFPKKAFTKLCEQAMSQVDCNCRPWVRPDDDRAPAGGYCELINILVRKNGNRHALDNSTTHNFDPKMRKSLIQLDTFLETAYMLSSHSNSTSNAINSTLTSGDIEEMSTRRAAITIAEAWSTFCRQEDTENLVVPSTVSKEPECKKDELVANAAKLGQYFASDENAKNVVKTVFKLLPNMKQFNGSIASDRVLFVEPSCGDGRIIEELLQSSENEESNMIYGVDIDPISLEKADQKFDRSKVILKCADFLSLRRDDLLTETSCTEDMTLVALGGPPYTPKCLPERFILHCAQELKAQIVVFILPDRCAKDADNIQKKLNSQHGHDESHWCYTNDALDNILFNFKDTTVLQPSILQSWYKRPETK